MKFLPALLLAASLVPLFLAPARAEPPAPPSSEAREAALFERPVVLGASVSDGFNIRQPLGGPGVAEYRIGNYLAAALGLNSPLPTHANRFLFMNPLPTMEKQVAETLARRPSLVVAVDALFWFCYGADLSPEARKERLEQGLSLLDRINVPMIVGDIPDASGAIGKILNASQVPDRATLEACNARIRKWAETKGRITVFPLADLLSQAAGGTLRKIGTLEIPPDHAGEMMQPDGLHPTQRGTAALAIAALEQAAAELGSATDATHIIRDLGTVFERGLAAAAVTSRAPSAEAVGVP